MKVFKTYGTAIVTQEKLGLQFERRLSKSPVYTEVPLGHKPDTPTGARSTRPHEANNGEHDLRVIKVTFPGIYDHEKTGFIKTTVITTQFEHVIVNELATDGKKVDYYASARCPRGYLSAEMLRREANALYKAAKMNAR